MPSSSFQSIWNSEVSASRKQVAKNKKKENTGNNFEDLTSEMDSQTDLVKHRPTIYNFILVP